MISQPLFTRLTCLGLSLISVKEKERVSGKVSNQRFVNSCLANSPECLYIHSYTHLITSSELNECLLVHNFIKKMLHRMSLITGNAKEYRRMTAQ